MDPLQVPHRGGDLPAAAHTATPDTEALKNLAIQAFGGQTRRVRIDEGYAIPVGLYLASAEGIFNVVGKRVLEIQDVTVTESERTIITFGKGGFPVLEMDVEETLVKSVRPVRVEALTNS